MTSRDLRWPEVTRKWRHLTGSLVEVAVEGRKLAYTVHFTSYKAVAHGRRQSRDKKWRHVTSGDWKWPGSDVIWPEATWKRLWKAKNWHILYISLPTRLYLAGGISHATGNDVTWPQVKGSDPETTSFDHKWPRSGCRSPKTRVYCTFQFLQGCSLQRRQSRDRKWRRVTLGDPKWPGSDVIWPEMTSKWLWKVEHWRILYISLPSRL